MRTFDELVNYTTGTGGYVSGNSDFISKQAKVAGNSVIKQNKLEAESVYEQMVDANTQWGRRGSGTAAIDLALSAGAGVLNVANSLYGAADVLLSPVDVYTGKRGSIAEGLSDRGLDVSGNLDRSVAYLKSLQSDVQKNSDDKVQVLFDEIKGEASANRNGDFVHDAAVELGALVDTGTTLVNNPVATVGMLMEQLPQLALGAGVGNVASKVAARGMSAEMLASNAGKKIVQGSVEAGNTLYTAAASAGGTNNQIRRELKALPESYFTDTIEGSAMLKEGKTPSQIKRSIIIESSQKGGLINGVLSSFISKGTGAGRAEGLGHNVGSTLRNSLREGAEEGLQEASNNAVVNEALGRDLTDGIGLASGTGAALGVGTVVGTSPARIAREGIQAAVDIDSAGRSILRNTEADSIVSTGGTSDVVVDNLNSLDANVGNVVQEVIDDASATYSLGNEQRRGLLSLEDAKGLEVNSETSAYIDKLESLTPNSEPLLKAQAKVHKLLTTGENAKTELEAFRASGIGVTDVNELAMINAAIRETNIVADSVVLNESDRVTTDNRNMFSDGRAFLPALLQEIEGTTDSNAALHRLSAESKRRIEQEGSVASAQSLEQMQGAFKSLSDRESAALERVVVNTGTADRDILSDPDSAVTRLEEELKQVTQAFTKHASESKNRGKFRALGRGDLNVVSPMPEGSPELLDVLERLDTAYAVQATDRSDRTFVLDVIDREASDDVGAVDLLVQNLKDNGSREALGDIEYRLSEPDNEALLKEGFVSQESFQRSSRDRRDTPINLYTRKDRGTDLKGGIVPLAGQRMGIDVGSPTVGNHDSELSLVEQDGKFSYTLSNALKEKYLGKTYDAPLAVSKGIGDTASLANSGENNKAISQFLREDFKENYKDNPSDFIRVHKDSADKDMRHVFDSMSPELKALNVDAWGSDDVFINRKYIRTLFGQRKFQVAELKHIKSNQDNIAKRLLHDSVKFLEDGTRELTQQIKKAVVIKNGSTLMGNIASNNSLLWMKGLSVLETSRSQLEGVKLIRKYERDLKALMGAKALNKVKPTSGRTAQIESLENAIADNGMTELIEAGSLQVEFEDISSSDSGIVDGVRKRVKPLTDLLPEFMKDIVKNTSMTEDSYTYQLLHNTTQKSDLVSRYALHKYNIKEGMTHEASLRDIDETFINYDLPSHPSIQYANDLGLTLFTKYKLRVLKVLATLYKDSPLRMAGHRVVESQITGDISSVDDTGGIEFGLPPADSLSVTPLFNLSV